MLSMKLVGGKKEQLWRTWTWQLGQLLEGGSSFTWEM